MRHASRVKTLDKEMSIQKIIYKRIFASVTTGGQGLRDNDQH